MDNTNAAKCNDPGGAITDRDRFYQMCEHLFEEQVKQLPYVGVTKQQLERISCIQLKNMGVDIDLPRDFASSARFFEPSPAIVDGLKNILSQHWCDLGELEAQQLYPRCKETWFMIPWDEVDLNDELHMDRFGGTAWRCEEARSDRWELGRTTGLILPRGVRDNLHRHQYFSGTAFFPKDENKPHLSCIVSDTFISPDSMLRSEVHGAVALIKYQLTSQRCSDHRIKPVMVYTFQMDQYARITETYFDRDIGKIVLRQSRQFDLRGPKPTEDAWLLLRWILTEPVGDTLDT